MRVFESSTRRSIAAVAIALAGLSAPAAAQELRGAVRDSVSRRPVSGAVLLLLDSAGATLGRNITNERGEYRIALVPAIRAMRVQRIGFRPRTVTIARVDSGFPILDVGMLALPAFLEPMKVVDRRNCPRRSDAPLAFALWDQARAALLATVVARETQPATVVRLRFDRRMDKDRIVDQTVRIDSTETSRPFIAVRPAADFVAKGFLGDSAGKPVLAAPDADVMLDDAFGKGYCFRIAAASAARPQEIGLAFSPAKRERGRIDIHGVIWIDSTTRSLTRLEYRYLGLDRRLDAFEPGGRVEFRAMPNGSTMIDRWFIRVVAADSNVTRVDRARGVGLEAHEIGGEMATATWADGQTWHAPLGAVKGRLAYKDGADPRATLELIGTPYRSAVAADGAFEISNLLPGPYRVATVDARLADLGIALNTGVQFTAERDSTTTLLVEIPSTEESLATLCEEKDSVGQVIFVVRVNLPDGTPARGAKVVIRPYRDDNEKHVLRTATDDHGLVRVCPAPSYGALEVRAEAKGTNPVVGVGTMDAKLVTMILQLKAASP